MIRTQLKGSCNDSPEIRHAGAILADAKLEKFYEKERQEKNFPLTWQPELFF